MINATDRNTINHDCFQFYFNKLLFLNNIKIQIDVLTKEMVKARGLKQLSSFGGIIGWRLVIFSYIYPDTIIKNVGAIAMGPSNIMKKANTLVNVGYGEDLGAETACGEPSMSTDDLLSDYTNSQSDHTDLRNSFVNAIRKLVTPIKKIQEEYINEEMGILNRTGGKFLTRLYGNNEEFREEIINFVRDKKRIRP